MAARNLMAFNVYRSSAGSGKTFTLVRDYLLLLLQQPGMLKQILAVTFTNKAADEMKQRIIGSLAQISFSADPLSLPMAKALVEAGLDADHLKEKSREALVSILHDYNDFSVGTIDSFMHRLVRTFARDIHIPAHFEIGLDESETQKLVSEVLLERVGADEGLTHILIDFLSFNFDQQQSMDYESRIREYVGHMLKEDARPYLDQLAGFDQEQYTSLAQLLKDRLAMLDRKAKELGEEGVRLIRSNGLDYSDFHSGKFGPLGFYEKLKNTGVEALPPGKRMTAAAESGTWYNAKASPTQKSVIEKLSPELDRLWEQTLTMSDTGLILYRNDQLIQKHLFLLALAARIQKVLLDLRYDQQHLPISDINSLVAEVALNEAVPFIYERLGEKYRHFLLDEFQDTSVLQWHNLVPLIENALSEGGSALIVGDGKQSIYRWRSGDATQFQQLPQLWVERDYPQRAEREKTLQQYYHSHYLGSNFRSAEGLVSFNNDFFRFASRHLNTELQETYAKLEQKTAIVGHPSLLQVRFLTEGEQGRDHLFDSHVLSLVEEASRHHPLSDIAILCRDNRLGTTLAQFLLKNGYPVLSAESVLIGTSPRVRTLLACIRLLSINPERLYMAELLRDMHLSGLFGEENLQALWHESGVQQSKTNAAPFFEWMQTRGFVLQPAYLRSLSLYDLCEALMRVFGFDHLSDVYLQFLLEVLVEYLDTKDGSLEGFLQWWDETGSKRSVNVPPGMDAVRIMTIHKAKGLEFPVVIYPVKDNGPGMTRREKWVELDPAAYAGQEVAYISLTQKAEGTSWADVYTSEKHKSALDLLNIHYVAMTRASSALFVLLEEKKEYTGEETTALEEMKLAPLMRAFLKEKVQPEDDGTYSLGELPERESRPERKEMEPAFDLISLPWNERLTVRLSAPESWSAGSTEDAASRGSLIHRILSAIHTREDIARALNAECLQGKLREDALTGMDAQIREMLSHPDLAPYYESTWTVKNEAAIILPDGHILRPDRVVIRGEEAVVIDYKTGRQDQKHKTQILQYADVLKKMGYVVRKSILAYLDEGIMVEVA